VIGSIILEQSEYEIENPLPEWRLIGQKPICGHCGKALHLLFDLSAKRATAECECVEDLGGSRREEIRRSVITIR
jgi:hypothetical protein